MHHFYPADFVPKAGLKLTIPPFLVRCLNRYPKLALGNREEEVKKLFPAGPKYVRYAATCKKAAGMFVAPVICSANFKKPPPAEKLCWR